MVAGLNIIPILPGGQQDEASPVEKEVEANICHSEAFYCNEKHKFTRSENY